MSRSKLPDQLNRWEPWIAGRTGAAAAGWLCVAVLIVLAGTWRFTQPEGCPFDLNVERDVNNIYGAASVATLRDVPTWFAGPWVYPNLNYYRPLSSVLFAVECHAFGRDWTPYKYVTLLLHLTNVALLFLFIRRLVGAERRIACISAAVGAVYFGLPNKEIMLAISFSIGWWPSQNDVLCLTWGLASFILFDRYLHSRRHSTLAWAAILYLLAIGTKEIAYGFLPMFILLALYRHALRNPAIWLPWGVAAVMLVYRKFVLPGAELPPILTRMGLIRWLRYVFQPIYVELLSGGTWIVAVAAVTGFVLICCIERKKRFRYCLLATLGSVTVSMQILQPQIGVILLMVPVMFSRTAAVFVFIVGSYMIWRCRGRLPCALASIAFAFSFVPILPFVGYHYGYVPGAFGGTLNGIAAASLLLWGKDTCLALGKIQLQTSNHVDSAAAHSS